MYFPLHSAGYPAAKLPTDPAAILNTIITRVGVRSQLSRQALDLLAILEENKKASLLFRETPDQTVEHLYWTGYQDQTDPELCILIGRLGSREFAVITRESGLACRLEGVTSQRDKFIAFRQQIQDATNTYLGIAA